jgi:hypothetical protein
MRKRIGVGLAACCGALAIGVGIAQAGIPTGIVMDGSGYSGSSLENSWVVGHLESSNEKCISGRKVKVSFHYFEEAQPRLVDTGRSTASGAFVGYGPTAHGDMGPEVDSFRISVASKNIGTKKHPKICASFQDDFPRF